MSDGAIPWTERPIALAGFMGVGKTAIGRSLAAALNWRFVDSDDRCVEILGTSIAAAFAAGEVEHFRDVEAAVVAELVEGGPGTVIALGGGALGRPESLERLLAGSLLVHLDLPWDQLAGVLERLRRGRPLLAGADEASTRRLFEERQATYAKCHVQVPLRRNGIPAGRDAVLAAIAPFGIGAAPRTATAGPLP